MTRQHLAGELSVRLEQLRAVAPAKGTEEVERLRRHVESCPLTWLGAALIRAIALADGLCWDSLALGNAALFARQASISAELRLFGICSGLLAED